MLRRRCSALVGLLLAFGLTLAVGRYEDRRAATVAEANAIGTTYLGPSCSRSPRGAVARSASAIHGPRPAGLRRGAGERGDAPHDGSRRRAAAAALEARRAGDRTAPVASAPRLYVDSLNSTIDRRRRGSRRSTTAFPARCSRSRCSARHRARPARAVHLAARPRARADVAAAALVTLLLLVTFDLDRPTRGLITVPATPLDASARRWCPRRPQGPRLARRLRRVVGVSASSRGIRCNCRGMNRSIQSTPSAAITQTSEARGQSANGAAARMKPPTAGPTVPASPHERLCTAK